MYESDRVLSAQIGTCFHTGTVHRSYVNDIALKGKKKKRKTETKRFSVKLIGFHDVTLDTTFKIEKEMTEASRSKFENSRMWTSIFNE